MYWTIALADTDKDIQRFVWRDSSCEPIRDYCKTHHFRCVHIIIWCQHLQNTINHASQFLLATKDNAFYVDDGITELILQKKPCNSSINFHSLFSLGGFVLLQWNSTEPAVLDHIDPEMKDTIGASAQQS